MYAMELILDVVYVYEIFSINLLLKSYRSIYVELQWIFFSNMGNLECGVNKESFQSGKNVDIFSQNFMSTKSQMVDAFR